MKIKIYMRYTVQPMVVMAKRLLAFQTCAVILQFMLVPVMASLKDTLVRRVGKKVLH